MKDKPELITIAHIVKPQGIRGEVKIKPLTDSAERFFSLTEAYVGGKLYEIENVRILPSGIFISFKGVCDRDSAEKLRNRYLQVSRDNAVCLPEGRYFIVDLIGCVVQFFDGQVLGTLKEVHQHGAADIYEVKAEDGKSVMFPALKKTLLNVDVKNKSIVIDKKTFDETVVFED